MQRPRNCGLLLSEIGWLLGTTLFAICLFDPIGRPNAASAGQAPAPAPPPDVAPAPAPPEDPIASHAPKKGPAAAPAPPPEMTDADRQKLRTDGDRLGKEARELAAQGNRAGAIAAVEKKIEIERRLLENTFDKNALGNKLADSLAWLGFLCREDHNDAKAKKCFTEVLDLLKPVKEEDPRYVWTLDNLASLYLSGREFVLADSLYRRLLENRRRVVGETHPDYAKSLNNLGWLYFSEGDYRRAEPLYLQALDIWKKSPGVANPDFVRTLNNLVMLYDSQGNYAKAEPLYQQVLDFRRKAVDVTQPEYARSLKELADWYRKAGDFYRAEPLFRDVLAVQTNALGKAHPDTAATFDELDALYATMVERCVEARAFGAAQRAQKERVRLLTERYGKTDSRTKDAQTKLTELEQQELHPKPAPLHFEMTNARGLDIPAPSPFNTSKHSRERFAVCVGINGYRHAYPALQYAGQDAAGVARALLDRCGFEHVLLITDLPLEPSIVDAYRAPGHAPRLQLVTDVSRNSIRDNSENFLAGADGEEDIVVFYFAGHGDKRPPELVAGDYNGDRALLTTLPLSVVFDWATVPHNRLFLFDACRSSPGGGQFTMPRELRQALADPPAGTTVISACDANESAWEDSAFQHGRFSWALIESLEGRACGAPRGALSFSHLHECIEAKFDDMKKEKRWMDEQHPCMFAAVNRVTFLRDGTVDSQTADDHVEDAVRKLQELALSEYQKNNLDRAEQLYQQCLGLLATVRQPTSEQRQLLARLNAQYSCLLFRTGHSTEARKAEAEARKTLKDDAALHELEGYRKLAGCGYFDAVRELGLAVQMGQRSGVSPYLLSNYGVALYHMDRFSDAGEAFEKAAALFEKIGPDDEQGRSLERAAKCFAKAGNHKRAYELLSKSCEFLLQQRHEHNPRARADLLDKISSLLLDEHNPGDAERALLKSQEIRKRTFGDDSSQYAMGELRLGQLYVTAKKFDQAETALEEARRRLLDIYGKNHPRYAQVLTALATDFRHQGRLQDAERNLSAALLIQQSVYSPFNRQLVATQKEWVALQQRMGDYTKVASSVQASKPSYHELPTVRFDRSGCQAPEPTAAAGP